MVWRMGGKMLSWNISVHYSIYTSVHISKCPIVVVPAPNEFFNITKCLQLFCLPTSQPGNQSIKRWQKFHYNCTCCMPLGCWANRPHIFTSLNLLLHKNMLFQMVWHLMAWLSTKWWQQQKYAALVEWNGMEVWQTDLHYFSAHF